MPAMAALKKSDEDKFKAICTGVRTDGAYIEAGENDNLIVQKLAPTPARSASSAIAYLEENPSKLKGIAINGVAPTYADDQQLPISRRASALHLRQERPCRRHPGDPRLRRRIHQGKRVRARTAICAAGGLVAAPNDVRARSQQAARALAPLNLASLK